MSQKSRKQGGIPSLFLRMLLWSTLLWVLLLGITLGLTLHFSLSTLEEEIEGNLISTSSSLAQSDMVRRALQEGYCSEEMIDYLDLLVQQTQDLDIITIANTDSIRLYHVVHSRIGQRFVGGDEGPALEGESYLSDAVGTLGYQHRSFTPVLDETGQVIGFVVTSTTMDRLDTLRGEIVQIYLHLAILLMLVTLTLSAALSLLIRQGLHGFSPEQLIRNYLTQNELLNNLEEGVVSTDRQGVIRMVNQAAEEMLGHQAQLLEGRPLDRFISGKDGGSLLERTGETLTTSHPNVLSTCIPLEKNGTRNGSILILRDKSETMREAEQLNGTRHIISALRANSHEFMNKLHVISGLLQMNKAEEALSYIGTVSALQSQTIDPILQRIHNPNVAALLLGKETNAREMDIQLTLLNNSYLPQHSRFLSTADLITVVGNLLENAMEAVNVQHQGSLRSVVLQITEDEGCLVIMVTDTGSGITPQVMEHMSESGSSTKAGDGRGVGMSLIQGIVTRCDAGIEVDSEPGSGTTFTLIFSTPREDRRK